MRSPVLQEPPAVRPAILRGRRVDFWPAADWAAICPGWRPAGGYWRQPATGRLLSALAVCQSDVAFEILRRSGRSWKLSLAEARSADAGQPALWTCRLTPLPPTIAEAFLAGGGLRHQQKRIA